MFIGREIEKEDLWAFISSDKTKAALIYGRRRIGKTTLIKTVLEEKKVNHIFFEALEAEYETNLGMLNQLLSDKLGLPMGRFRSFIDLFTLLNMTKERLVIVLDEYQYMKMSRKDNSIDSEFKQIIDNLPENIKLILTGSYLTKMKEILSYENPLFGRFQLIQNIKELDYLTSRRFYPSLSYRDSVCFYAIFGGSPFMLEAIDENSSLEENVRRLILNPTGIVRTYIEFILFKEIGKVSYLNDILRIIGNGKLRYSQIEASLNLKSNGLLSKYLSILEQMELIGRSRPINRKDDEKKTFYSINDNLIRFYFAYIQPHTSELRNIGEEAFYGRYIIPSLTTFISYRFEAIVRDYLKRKASSSPILDIGTYWCDDKDTKRNDEFDCVVRHPAGYTVYEAKFLSRPMTPGEMEEEAEKIRNIKALGDISIGFASAEGFERMPEGYEYITLEDIYS